MLFAQVPTNKDAVLGILCGLLYTTSSEMDFQSGEAATIVKARLKSFIVSSLQTPVFIQDIYFHNYQGQSLAK